MERLPRGTRMGTMKCPNCDEEIDDASFKEGVCGKCGTELRYGADGCAG